MKDGGTGCSLSVLGDGCNLSSIQQPTIGYLSRTGHYFKLRLHFSNPRILSSLDEKETGNLAIYT